MHEVQSGMIKKHIIPSPNAEERKQKNPNLSHLSKAAHNPPPRTIRAT
jgi:hypothetical protein